MDVKKVRTLLDEIYLGAEVSAADAKTADDIGGDLVFVLMAACGRALHRVGGDREKLVDFINRMLSRFDKPVTSVEE